MAEHKFTKELKNNIAKKIAVLLNDKLDQSKFKVETEYKLPDNSRIDIGIVSKFDKAIKDENGVNKIVGIEIEVISNENQIFTNHDSFQKFVFAKEKRRGGLIHLICTEADIWTTNVGVLLAKGFEGVSQGEFFYYDFHRFDIENMNAYVKKATQITNDWEFQARLLSMMKLVFDLDINNYKSNF